MENLVDFKKALNQKETHASVKKHVLLTKEGHLINTHYGRAHLPSPYALFRHGDRLITYCRLYYLSFYGKLSPIENVKLVDKDEGYILSNYKIYRNRYAKRVKGLDNVYYFESSFYVKDGDRYQPISVIYKPSPYLLIDKKLISVRKLLVDTFYPKEHWKDWRWSKSKSTALRHLVRKWI